jgi:hypothetical protein
VLPLFREYESSHTIWFSPSTLEELGKLKKLT